MLPGALASHDHSICVCTIVYSKNFLFEHNRLMFRNGLSLVMTQVPGIIVAISAGIRWDDYGGESNCWLSTSHGTIWAFVGPMLFVIACNIVVFVLCLRSILDMGRRIRRRSSSVEEVCSLR